MESLEKAMADHIDWLMHARGRSPHTIRAYKSDLSKFALYCKSGNRDVACPNTLSNYIKYLMMEKGAAPRTVKRKVACLGGFFKRSVQLGLLVVSPADAIDVALPKSRSLPRALSRDDASRLAGAALAQSKFQESREVFDFSVAVLLLLTTGLRINELLTIQRRDFDEFDGSLIVRGKGRRERRVFVVDSGLLSLMRFVARDAPTHPHALFFFAGATMSAARFRKTLRALSTSAGLRIRVTPHMLRHTAATLLLEDGVDLLFLQRLLGHENISTTALYAHVGNASLKNALRKADLLQSLAA